MTYKRISYTLLATITGILCFLAILFSTPLGAKLSFYVIKGIYPINVEYDSGALLNDLVLKQVSIETDDKRIDAKDIQLKLHLRCIWKSQLCIDELTIASLEVDLKANAVTGKPAEASNESQNISLPFTVKMKRFFLAEAKMTHSGGEVHLSNFSSALTIKKNLTNVVAVNIDKSTLAEATIYLNDTSASASQVVKTVVEPWPLSALPEISLPVKLTATSVVVNTLNVIERDISAKEKPLVSITHVVARLSWFKNQLLIQELSSKIDKIGDLLLTGKVNFIPPYTLDVKIKSVIDHFELLPQLNNSSQDIFLQGNIAQLITTIDSKGELALTSQLTVDLTRAHLPYKLSAQVSKFSLPDDLADIVSPSSLQLSSEGNISQHIINVESNVTGFGYQNALLALNATYNHQILKINTLHLEESHGKNSLQIKGELQLGEQLSWDVKLNSSGFTLPTIDERISGRVQGNINSKGYWHGKQWGLSLVNSTLEGEINNKKLYANGNIKVNHKGELSPSEMVINYGEMGVLFKGYSDEYWHVNGTVDLGEISDFVKNAEGGLHARFSILGLAQQPEININGQITKIFFEKLSSDEISFEAKYSPLNNHAHKVSLTSPLISWDKYKIDQVKLASVGDLNQQQFNVQWLGDSSIDLFINSHYSPLDGQWELASEQANLSVGKQAFSADKPLHVVYNKSNNTLAIKQHCWLGTGTKLCLNQDTHFNMTQGGLALNVELGTALLTPLIPKDVQLDSSLSGKLNIAWKPDTMPSLNANLLISEGQLQINQEESEHTLLEWQNGQLNLLFADNNVSGDIALFSVDSVEMFNANTAFSLNEDGNIKGKVSVNDINLSPLQVLVPELSLLEGKLASELTLEGNLNRPKITGNIALSQGKTKILGNINTLDNINMAIDFKGYQAVISGGLNINNVAATLTGDADWQDTLKGNLNFDGERLPFSVPPDLTLTVAPHLSAQLTASALKLSGRVEVLDGKLSINKLPQGSVSLSSDAIIVDEHGVQVSNDKPFDVSTNIRVVIADAFKVDGQGFVGRLGGELQMSQQPHQPLQLFGSLNVPEGRYRAYGQDLTMTKGLISFNGPANNPYVTLQATRSIEKEDIIVGIDATGLANSLNIKLFSKPTMQQSETLSYLVRGKGLDAETNDSNTAIGVALGTAITNFSGVLTQIEKLPLINRIEIDGDEKQASIAGYLGDKVYIKYGIGILEPINELTVRFYLLNRLWVETVSGLENSADIYYSFDLK
ncbi:translocation/assembly module TamB domain-containing protein [Thalassotalea piscium]